MSNKFELIKIANKDTYGKKITYLPDQYHCRYAKGKNRPFSARHELDDWSDARQDHTI